MSRWAKKRRNDKEKNVWDKEYSRLCKEADKK